MSAHTCLCESCMCRRSCTHSVHTHTQTRAHKHLSDHACVIPACAEEAGQAGLTRGGSRGPSNTQSLDQDTRPDLQHVQGRGGPNGSVVSGKHVQKKLHTFSTHTYTNVQRCGGPNGQVVSGKEIRVVRNHTCIRMYGVYTVCLTEELPNIRSYTVIIHGFGQPYPSMYILTQTN